MLEEYLLCSGLDTFEDKEVDDNHASDCEVLPVPIPRLIQVPGPGESHSNHSDEYLCLDSNNEQELRATRPVDNNLLSNVTQFIEFCNISHSSKTATSVTKSLATLLICRLN